MLRKKIITNDFADWMLEQVTQIYNKDYYNLNVFNAIGHSVSGVSDFVRDISRGGSPISADVSLIAVWEYILGITPKANQTLNARRANVAAAFVASQRKNKYRVERLLELYVPNGTVEIVEHYNEYTIDVIVRMGQDGYDQVSMLEALEEYKPAHIAYNSVNYHAHTLYLGATTLSGDDVTLMPSYPVFSDMRQSIKLANIVYGADSFIVMPKKAVYTDIRNNTKVGTALYAVDVVSLNFKGEV